MDACKCDKMFSERLAEVTAQCQVDQANGIMDSPFCPNEDFRTESGGGSFDPFDESEGKFELRVWSSILNYFLVACEIGKLFSGVFCWIFNSKGPRAVVESTNPFSVKSL